MALIISRCIVLLSCVGLTGALQVTMFGQAADKVEASLTAMRSTVQQERIRGFYDLLQDGSDRSKAFRASTAFVKLLGAVPSQADALKKVLFATLARENAIVRQADRKNGTLTEAYSEYYGDLIAAVAALRDPRSVDALVGAIGTGNMATSALAAIGSPAVDPVIEKTKDLDKRTRQGAALTLGKMVDPDLALANDIRPSREKVKQALLQTLGDPEGSVRASSISALSSLKDPEVVEKLQRISTHDPYKLRTKDVDVFPVREAAKKALANMR